MQRRSGNPMRTDKKEILDMLYFILNEFVALKIEFIKMLENKIVTLNLVSKIPPGWIKDNDGNDWYYYQHGYSLCFHRKRRYSIMLNVDCLDDVELFSPDSFFDYLRTRKNKGCWREIIKKLTIADIRDFFSDLITENRVISCETPPHGLLFKRKT